MADSAAGNYIQSGINKALKDRLTNLSAGSAPSQSQATVAMPDAPNVPTTPTDLTPVPVAGETFPLHDGIANDPNSAFNQALKNRKNSPSNQGTGSGN